MRDIDVISKGDKRVTVDQDGDAFHFYVSVPHACVSLELTLEEADDVATALARLVEGRNRELHPPVEPIRAPA